MKVTVQDINLNQLKLKLNDTQKKEEKITTRFKAVNDEDARNKECLDKKLAEVKRHLSHREKDYNEYNDHERHNGEVLIEKAVKTTIQILYDKVLFDTYDNADEILKDFLFIEVNDRRRTDVNQINAIDKVIQ